MTVMRVPAASLATLEAVIRLGSLKAAASELAITEGAVSRQLSNLSSLLGAPLFSRSGRRLEATADARTLAQEVRVSNARLADAIARFQRKHAEMPLRIAALPTFTTLWLIPRLGKLREALPRLSVTIVTHTDPNAFLLNDGLADVLIDVGRWPQKRDLAHAEFMEDTSGPVLSPRLAASCGGIASPADLARIPYLSTRSRPTMLEDWCRAAGVPPPPGTLREQFDHKYHTIQAATAGLGFALASRCYVGDALERGELVAPLGLTVRQIPFYLAWPRRLDDDPRVRALLGWLREEAARIGLPAG